MPADGGRRRFALTRSVALSSMDRKRATSGGIDARTLDAAIIDQRLDDFDARVDPVAGVDAAVRNDTFEVAP